MKDFMQIYTKKCFKIKCSKKWRAIQDLLRFSDWSYFAYEHRLDIQITLCEKEETIFVVCKFLKGYNF